MPAAVQAVSPSRNVVPGDAARFVVGRDRDGRWVAVEVHGRAGGLFRSREAAIGYVEGETGRRPDAMQMSEGRVELRL